MNETCKDDGHNQLLLDLGQIYKDATDYQFHDFKNTDHAAPKIALVMMLEDVILKVKEGKYDNFEEPELTKDKE